jgi:hypothetical protein
MLIGKNTQENKIDGDFLQFKASSFTGLFAPILRKLKQIMQKLNITIKLNGLANFAHQMEEYGCL